MVHQEQGDAKECVTTRLLTRLSEDQNDAELEDVIKNITGTAYAGKGQL